MWCVGRSCGLCPFGSLGLQCSRLSCSLSIRFVARLTAHRFVFLHCLLATHTHTHTYFCGFNFASDTRCGPTTLRACAVLTQLMCTLPLHWLTLSFFTPHGAAPSAVACCMAVASSPKTNQSLFCFVLVFLFLLKLLPFFQGCFFFLVFFYIKVAVRCCCSPCILFICKRNLVLRDLRLSTPHSSSSFG